MQRNEPQPVLMERKSAMDTVRPISLSDAQWQLFAAWLGLLLGPPREPVESAEVVNLAAYRRAHRR